MGAAPSNRPSVQSDKSPQKETERRTHKWQKWNSHSFNWVTEDKSHKMRQQQPELTKLSNWWQRGKVYNNHN